MTSTLNLANLQPSQGFKITGTNAGDNSGYSVSTGGDINGDGYDDIVIGAYLADSYNGKTYVIFGKANGISNINLPITNNSQGFSLTGSDSNRSGYSVSITGDINGDGYNDIITGEPLANAHISNNNIIYNAGIVYVIWGKSNNFSNINLASLDSSQGFKIYGNTNEKIGFSVSAAGDVNNDGYADIVIGAPSANSNAGVAYIIFGSSNPSDIALSSLTPSKGIKITGESAGDSAGQSVAAAGDVNKDGYDDIIIGAPGASSNTGKSYVLLGGKALTNVNLISMTKKQGFFITGCNVADGSGYSVSGTDINGDGYSDLIMGVPSAWGAGGGTYIVFGTKSANNLNMCDIYLGPGWTIWSNHNGDNSGRSVSGVGDINGDGLNDFIVGAYSVNSSRGTNYVIYGKVSGFIETEIHSLTAAQGFSITGENAEDHSGWSVSGGGDINGDGFADIIIGAPGANNAAGTTYAIFGSSSGFVTNSPTKAPSQAPTIAPTATLQNGLIAYYPFDGNANDVSGNGNNGITHNTTLVEDRFANPNSAYSFDGSTSYLYFPGELLSPINDMSLSFWIKPSNTQSSWISIFDKSRSVVSGQYTGDWFLFQYGGSTNCYYFDFVCPGHYLASSESCDIQLTANSWSHVVVTKGTNIQYYINTALVYTKSFSTKNILTNKGYPLLIGATNGVGAYPPENLANFYKGSLDDIFIYNRTLSATEVMELYNFTLSQFTRTPTITPSQSLNPSAIPTLRATKPSTAKQTHSPTRHHLMASNIDLTNLTSAQGFVINGASAGDQAGYSVSGAGDVNGDGYQDIIIGALGNYDSGSGLIYVLFGENINFNDIDLNNITASQGFKIYNGGAHLTRISVSNVGDINKDGYADIVVGMLSGNYGNNECVVIFGKLNLTDINLNTMPLSQGFYIDSGSSFSHFQAIGISVSGIGDINGDGYADIAIGALSALTEGFGYVLFGKQSGFSNIYLPNIISNNTMGFAIYGHMNVGTVAYDLSIIGAGDINADGYSDIIIGSQDPNTNAGLSYVVFGRQTFTNLNLTTLDPEFGFSISGENVDGARGSSVSAAGDINADGYSDLVIGTFYKWTAMGISYVVYGTRDNYNNVNLANLTINQGFSITGAHAKDFSGYSVKSAGDVNNDGFDDFIIGAIYADSLGKSEAGAVYVIFGKNNNNNINLANLNPSQGFVVYGSMANAYTGISVNGAGDINKDGYDDIIIGAPGINSNAGAAYVIYGDAFNTNWFPTGQPSDQPSIIPTDQPTSLPSDQPSIIPTDRPTSLPSDQPTSLPSDQPSTIPTSQPTNQPFSYPTSSPTHIRPATTLGLNKITNAQGFAISGVSSNYQTGKSTSSAGDVNNDGYDDILIGSPGFSSNSGIAYLIFGNSKATDLSLKTLSSSKGITIGGTGSGNYTGFAVASAGDFNGDHYSDFLISAYGFSSNTGKVYVIFGGNYLQNINLTNLNFSAGISITGAGPNYYTGYSLAKAGDINNDQYDDILISSYGYASNTGKVYIIYGGFAKQSIDLSLPLLLNQGFTVVGAEINYYTGFSLKSAGDVNGDKKADIIIGSYGASNNVGKAYLITNSSANSLSVCKVEIQKLSKYQGFTIVGENSGDKSGYVVNGAGDVNGDGIKDFLISSPYYSSNSGKVYLIYGNRTVGNLNLAKLTKWQGIAITGVASNYYAGSSISTAGDINSDGKDDFIIGSPNYLSNIGVVYVVYGASNYTSINLGSLKSSQGITIPGPGANYYLGSSVNRAGDVNGDGKADILIGAPAYSSNTGIVYLLYGGTSMNGINLGSLTSSKGISIVGAGAGYFTGYAISSAGDMNKDGKSEFVIGAYGYSSNTGRVYIIYGKTSLSNINLATLTSTQGIILTGAKTNDYTGFSLSGPVDFNGDGKSDIVIGAYGYSSNMGRVYVVYGDFNMVSMNLANLTTSQGIIINGATSAQQVGFSVSTAGDINQDNKTDILIGAPGTLSNTGRVYLVYGNSISKNLDLSLSMSNKTGCIVMGVDSGDYFGFSVSNLGDINGDSKIDFVIGAPQATNNMGRSYVITNPYAPAADILSINLGEFAINRGFTIIGKDIDYELGYTVNNAGDVNRDGKQDILICAPYYLSNTGILYLIYGSNAATNLKLNDLSSSKGIVINGAGTNYYTGFSAGYAGDINIDGFDDMIIGAFGYASNTGIVYLVYGSNTLSDINLASLTPAQGIIFVGASSNYYTGYSVCAAGDINGDGKTDIIIGARSGNLYTDIGYVYAIFGGNNLIGQSIISLASLASSQGIIISGSTYQFPIYQAFSGGDINGDGKNDVIISTVYAYGPSYIGFLYGSLTLINVAFSQLQKINMQAQALTSIAIVKDINGDHKDDILVSIPSYSANTGIVYLIFGSNNLNGIDINNMPTNVGIKITGANNNYNTGISLSGLGDINNDGKNDFLIGSPGYNSNKGKIYVIYGNRNLTNIDLSSPILTNKGFTVIGADVNHYAGFSASGIGDFNGDGRPDVLIGAYGASNNIGKAYVILHPYASKDSIVNVYLSELSAEQGIAISGQNAGDSFGYTVSSAGDFNGDGRSDLLISSPFYSSNKGLVYLIYGNSKLSNINVANIAFSQGISFISINADFTGFTLDSLGDINGDGYSDVLLGGYGYSSNTGKVYLVFGKKYNSNLNLNSLTVNQGVIFNGEGTNYYTGYSVSRAGDFNKDGFVDLLVGAYGYSSNTGKTYVIYGAGSGFKTFYPTSQPSAQPSRQPTSQPTKQPFAFPTAQPSVQPTDQPSAQPSRQPTSQPSAQPSEQPTGQPSREPSSQPTTQPSVQPSARPSVQPTDQPSAQPSRQPTSQPSAQPSEQPTGNPSAQPIAYPSSLPSIWPTNIPTEQPTTQPSVLPSVQPSALPSIIPTSEPSVAPSLYPSSKPTAQPSKQPSSHPSHQPTTSPSSQPTVTPSTQPTSGPTAQPSNIPTNIPSEQPSNKPSMQPSLQPSTQPSSNPTTPSSQPTSTPSLLAKELFGYIDLRYISSYQGLTIFGSTVGDNSGYAVRSAGDVNNDGLKDTIIGAHQASPYSRLHAGESYIIYGNSGKTSLTSLDLKKLNNYQGIKISGASAGDHSGCSVSTANDFNNDGFDDVIIGAYLASPLFRSNAGIVYIIYGSNLLRNIDLRFLNHLEGRVFYGANALDYTGYSISTAYDFNKDGFDDIIIGASQGSPLSRTNAGLTYVILGNIKNETYVDLLNFNNTVGFIIIGANAGDNNGFALNYAGDVNQDGYPDIIIGSPFASSNLRIASGETYIIFGNKIIADIDLANFNRWQGITIYGAQDNDNTGYSVSSAGDINGDGYIDFLIGAPYADIYSKVNVGVTYVIFGKQNLSNINLSKLNPKDGCIISGIAPGDLSGTSVSDAGYLNEDNYSDIIIGSFSASSKTRLRSGESYAIYGAQNFKCINLISLTSDKGVIISGANAFDYSGVSVSNVGDFNGDGYSDLLVGAYLASPLSRTKAGISYILYGGYNAPTGRPSSAPTKQPNSIPSSQPSSLPSVQPSLEPTGRPSKHPSSQPSVQPTNVPSTAPSAEPSIQPSSIPNSIPTSQPNAEPSTGPTTQPSEQPTSQPSDYPSWQPIGEPSGHPSCQPTLQPTNRPSVIPSVQLSTQPIGEPSSTPTFQPNAAPSLRPSAAPTIQPIGEPSSTPSAQPSSQPTEQPVASPTTQPSSQPSTQPTSHPSRKPIGKPSGAPSSRPTSVPTIKIAPGKTQKPTKPPTYHPSTQPTGEPTGNPTKLTLSVIDNGYGFKISNSILGYYGNSMSALSDVTISQGSLGTNYFIYGSKDRSSNIDLSRQDNGKFFPISGALNIDKTTRSIVNIGDFNRNGFNDLFIGDPFNSKAHIFYGNDNGFININIGFTIFGEVQNDFYGWAISSSGDFNGDGYNDLISSALNTNKVYITFGQGSQSSNIKLSSINPSKGIVLTTSNGIILGLAVEGVGDINADGYDDIAIAAFQPSKSSFIYIIFGCNQPQNINLASIFATQGFVITAPVQTSLSLGHLGDINQDGIDDFIIGSIPLLVSGQQASYVLYGSINISKINLNNINNIQGFKISGAGFIVSGPGDVNNDGINDILVTNFQNWHGNIGTYISTYPVNITSAPTMLPSSTPSSTPTAIPSSSPSIISTSAPTNFKQYVDSLLPSIQSSPSGTIPSLNPSFAPSGPTFNPTIVPSNSMRPSKAPISKPSPIPSKVKTNTPSTEPSFKPTTLFPTTFKPSFKPTKKPTEAPSINKNPTSYPSSEPSFNQESNFVSAVVCNGGTYKTANYKERLIINSTANVLIQAGNAPYMYTIIPTRDVAITITQFKLKTDIIDLSAFKQFRNLHDLDYQIPPLSINLNDSQSLVLNSEQAFTLTEVNFIFYTDDNMQNSQDDELFDKSLISALSWLIGTSAILLLAINYKNINNFIVQKLFNKKIDASSDKVNYLDQEKESNSALQASDNYDDHSFKLSSDSSKGDKTIENGDYSIMGALNHLLDEFGESLSEYSIPSRLSVISAEDTLEEEVASLLTNEECLVNRDHLYQPPINDNFLNEIEEYANELEDNIYDIPSPKKYDEELSLSGESFLKEGNEE